jgi:hypothetical protein
MPNYYVCHLFSTLTKNVCNCATDKTKYFPSFIFGMLQTLYIFDSCVFEVTARLEATYYSVINNY